MTLDSEGPMRLELRDIHKHYGKLHANDGITFQARFGGVARDIAIPIGNVAAIYARENGAGMAFEPESDSPADTPGAPESGAPEGEPEPPPPAGRPKLQRIK